MQSTLPTKIVRFAVLWAAFPNIKAKTYVEVPAVKRIQSLEDVIQWLERLNMPYEVVAQAFVSVEILGDRPPLNIKKIIQDHEENGHSDSLISLLNGPISALIDTIAIRQTAKIPDGNGDIETIELQILDIEKRDDTTPGIVVETSHGHDIAGDVEWWASAADFPGSVFGHISIEIFNSTLVAEANECLEAMYLGEPEKMEQLIGDKTLDIAKKLLAA